MKHNLKCLFTSDLHGNELKYKKLFHHIKVSPPDAVFIGGDLSRSIRNINGKNSNNDFFMLYILPELQKLKKYLKDLYPEIYIILGNDDSKALEEGINSSEIKDPEDKYKTIKLDLKNIADSNDLSQSIFLFHSPPYQSLLDRGDLDGRFIDHVPVDVHLGSIAIRDFICEHQPLITMHGHIHESTRLTGHWKDSLGKTTCFNGAHDGQELSIILFDPSDPASAKRELI